MFLSTFLFMIITILNQIGWKYRNALAGNGEAT